MSRGVSDEVGAADAELDQLREDAEAGVMHDWGGEASTTAGKRPRRSPTLRLSRPEAAARLKSSSSAPARRDFWAHRRGNRSGVAACNAARRETGSAVTRTR